MSVYLFNHNGVDQAVDVILYSNYSDTPPCTILLRRIRDELTDMLDMLLRIDCGNYISSEQREWFLLLDDMVKITVHNLFVSIKHLFTGYSLNRIEIKNRSGDIALFTA